VKLPQLQKQWDALGRSDPLWAVLTVPGRRGGGWDVDEFFALGRDEVRGHLQHMDELGLRIERQRALDFGCGVGRLTQGLAEHFESVVGVDIAPSMIDLARRHNRFGQRCQYYVNARSDLQLFPDANFDFVLSVIVLQHVEPPYSRGYVREFLRVLRPGGVAVFQAPSSFTPPQADDVYANGAAAPVLDGMWAAELTVEDAMRTMVASTTRTIRVGVLNRSDAPWSDRLPLNVGNHWSTPRGAVVVRDDGRGRVGVELQPGEATDTTITITAPDRAGRYLLQFDLVVEGQAWFADKGSSLLTIPMRVTGARRSLWTRLRNRTGEEPVMEMHCLPREDVESIVRDSGGSISEVAERDICGPGYTSYQYTVVKG
jgi:ubiquinone/menaquinone biosynthesis C-methylase UbiE